jgi:hypothetical protein
MPQVSIIIPTRNRSHLLEHALRSALAQDYDDFEVVVSNNGSSDSTREVAHSLATSRTRYLETPRTLGMPDHWEWALSQAAGRYFLFLCDDDVLAPTFLTRTTEVLERTGVGAVTCASATYTHPTWPVTCERNVLTVGVSTGHTVFCESDRVLEEVFSSLRYWCTPRCNNSLTRRDIALRIQDSTGRFFHAPSPDFTSCWLVLASTPRYCYIDEPLLVFGLAKESIGTSTASRRDEATLAFRAELAEEIFRFSPVRNYTIANNVAETLLLARSILPAELGRRQIDTSAFFLACRDDLERLGSNGIDVREELEELYSYLRHQSVRTKLAVWRRASFRRLRESPIGPSLQGLKRALLGPPPVDVDHSGRSVRFSGEAEGFTDASKCALHVTRLAARVRLEAAF